MSCCGVTSLSILPIDLFDFSSERSESFRCLVCYQLRICSVDSCQPPYSDIVQIGKISQAITLAPVEPTKIQKKLARLGKILVVLSLALCTLVVGISLVYKTTRSKPS
jgi:hypothetical protein